MDWLLATKDQTEDATLHEPGPDIIGGKEMMVLLPADRSYIIAVRDIEYVGRKHPLMDRFSNQLQDVVGWVEPHRYKRAIRYISVCSFFFFFFWKFISQ